MLTCWSTSGLESIVMEKPVISVAFLGDHEHLISHVDEKANGFDTFLRIYHTPEDLEELINLVNLGIKHELEPSQDMEFSKKFMRSSYNYPSSLSATESIVDDISESLSHASLNTIDIREALEVENSFLAVVNRYALIFHTPVFYLINKLYLFKYFIKDVLSGEYRSNSMHYALKNRSVDRFISKKFKR